MKFVNVREAKAHLSACLADSQTQGVVVTNHGKPQSVVIGVEGYDMEDVMLMLDPEFWTTIEARRSQPRTSLKDFEKELAAGPSKVNKPRRHLKMAG